MNHKRGKPKNQRAGCLMCKPHKMNGYGHTSRPHKGLNKTGFGKLRDAFLSLIDIKDQDQMLKWIKSKFLPTIVGYRPSWLKEQLKKK